MLTVSVNHLQDSQSNRWAHFNGLCNSFISIFFIYNSDGGSLLNTCRMRGWARAGKRRRAEWSMWCLPAPRVAHQLFTGVEKRKLLAFVVYVQHSYHPGDWHTRLFATIIHSCIQCVTYCYSHLSFCRGDCPIRFCPFFLSKLVLSICLVFPECLLIDSNHFLNLPGWPS